MKKNAAQKKLLLLTSLLGLTIVLGIIFVFFKPLATNAETYYKSINCPTPGPGKSSLQLIPCYPSGAVTNPPAQQQTTSATIAPTNPPPGTVESGKVCTPDSTVAKGASCKCSSDLEPDAVCTVPNALHCTQNGGFPSINSMGFQFGAGGFPLGYSLVAPTAGPGSQGAIQCIWLDTAPVPAAAGATNCTIECNSKPVIYFYSPKTLSVDVKLDIPGFVTESIPHYPANGWQNVTVHPQGTIDGTLSYQNKSYKELYYEDETSKATPPQEGFVIKTSDLKPSLREYTAKLGLNASEQAEFLNYWVPRLTDLHVPYIFFTVFDEAQKEKVDHVIVNPAPDTSIAFLAYFKPLNTPIQVAPLQFPVVPKRDGFTMVEWGGTIENN